MKRVALAEYKALYITIETLDKVDVPPEAQGKECHVFVSIGDKSVKSATAVIPEGVMEPTQSISFDSVLSFPFNYNEDKSILFALREKVSGVELGSYLLKLSLLEDRDATLLARMKLKSKMDTTIGYLNGRITMSFGGVARPSGARYVKNDKPRNVEMMSELKNSTQMGSIMWLSERYPDVIPIYDSVRHSTRAIQCSVYQIEDLIASLRDPIVEVMLGEVGLKTSMVRKVPINASVFAAHFDKTFVFPYNGERFFTFRVYDASSEHLHGEGAVDLERFVTRRPNVMGGSLSIEDVANGKVLGKLFFRLERFQSVKEMSVVENNEMAERFTDEVGPSVRATAKY